ncbi:NPCBM/NEW2 domain-containing protein, partial [bacterium]|nr:NPCBM/NEW2 domain-containing protein [bacterium]
ISVAQTNTIWLRELDLSKVQQGWSTVHVNTNLLNEPLSINKVSFANGICTHAYSEIEILLNKQALRFTALVGIDDHVSKGNYASIFFIVMGDNDTLFCSPIMGTNQQALPIDVSLVGYKKLTLITHDAFDGSNQDHGDWVNAAITYVGEQKPFTYYPESEAFYLQTPPTSDFPQINGAKISAARPGSRYLFRIPVTGKQPIKIQVCGLPKGLTFNPETNIISGEVTKAGTYNISIKASNAQGKVKTKHSIVIGNKLALTPPMGWNSWNAWGMGVSEEKVRETINAFDKYGLANHGWTYVSIDDGWQADNRNADSTLQWNSKFTNMKLL